MHRAALLLALCVNACSSSESNPGPVTADASTTADTSSATDGATSTDATPADVTSPTDAAGCPSGPPADMAACTNPGQLCEYPIDCGPQAGTFATCTNSQWNVVNRPCTTGDTGVGNNDAANNDAGGSDAATGG